MNIYEMNNKNIKKSIGKFNKTTYGKTVFLLAYSIPLIFFLMLLFLFISLYLCTCVGFFVKSAIMFLFPIFVNLVLLSFVLGSIYYYHELKAFIKENNSLNVK